MREKELKMAEKRVKERDVFTKRVEVGYSKKDGTPYLYLKTKENVLVFINLVKENKRFMPIIKKGTVALQVNYTSYQRSDRVKEGEVVDTTKPLNTTLFNVTDIVQLKE